MEQWIIPCNLKYYDVFGAFNNLKSVDWKQTCRSISVGDEVFIYVGKPVSAILYKCKVNCVNYKMPKIDDTAFVINGDPFENYGNYMELELLEKFNETQFHRDILVKHGLKGNIQGARRVNELTQLLNS